MSYKVRVSDTDQVFEVSRGEKVLDAALRQGVRLPHECTFGGCGTCRVRLQQGSVHYDEFPMALTEEEAAQGYALACQALADCDLVLTPAGKGPALPDPVRMQAAVRAVEPLTPEISRLVLQLPEDVDCDYRPGQHLNLLLPDLGERSFSMASAYPFGNEVELHVRHIPGGRFTSGRLAQLAADEVLEVEIPRGTFCYHAEDYRPMVFIATGTGFAPIRAILESLLDDEDCPPVSLYWGMRVEADLYAREELESWKDRLYEFKFVPVLSRAEAGWSGCRGHVQDALAAGLADVPECAFYLCGSPQMVTETKHLLLGLGADLDYIYSDSFTLKHNEKPVAA